MNGKIKISEIRKIHEKDILLESQAGDDPFELFESWLKTAVESELTEPNAMVLATSTPDGIPSARMMLLKELDERGFVFFTNYAGRKGRELAENPKAALVFYWYGLEKQVRVEGNIEKVTPIETEKYFHERPRESQIGAYASRQSEVLPGRDTLEKRYKDLSDKFSSKEIPVPDFWGGFRLVPESIEFWQGRPNRLHDRIRFRRKDKSWVKERLSP